MEHDTSCWKIKRRPTTSYLSLPKSEMEKLNMLISQMGIIVRISRKNMIRYCKAQLKGEWPIEIEHFGGKNLGHAQIITDWDDEEYQRFLTELLEESRSKKKKP